MGNDCTHYIFYYPFNYRQYNFRHFERKLKEEHYYHFKNSNHKENKKYYGEEVDISEESLKQFFYPFIEQKLINDRTSPVFFNRFTKLFQLEGAMQTPFEKIPFTIHSADIMLCPFSVGIMSIRIQLHNPISITSALSFAHYFRVLQPKIQEELGTTLEVNNQQFENTEELIFQKLAPFLDSFFVDYTHLHTTIPFFEDERMYVSCFLQIDEETELTNDLLYRIGQLDGRDTDGTPCISSNNKNYIDKFIDRHRYNRWAPEYTVMTTLQGHMHINKNINTLEKLLTEFHSTLYYVVIIHYFYKLTLLKLTFDYSELKYSRNRNIVEELIEQITKFSSRYYFSEVSMRAEGHELAHYFRDVFRLEAQYQDIKETLEELYRVQEDRAADRLNQLLYILTIFSMISGIYGMNLVIEELDQPLKWANILSFTLFEWIAFLLAIGGISISIFLVTGQLIATVKSFFDKRTARKRT